VIVFFKAPVPGLVKTRLIPRFGALRATRLYQAMAGDLLDRLATLTRAELEIRFAPAREEALVRDWLGGRYPLVPQRGRDLGARMAAAFGAAFRARRTRCVIVGSDVPGLSARLVATALDRLEREDVVVGPSHDGGYYLVGLREPHRELFTEMPWSTERVLAETVRRAVMGGLKVHLLPALGDIDVPADVARLRKRFARRTSAAGHMPRLKAWLDAEDRGVRAARPARRAGSGPGPR
jgi:hypothetical protein